jgi:hypothetical protein
LSIRKLFLSKWFWYGLIALGLLAFIFYLIPHYIQTEVFSPELGINLYSETWGLLFTLLLFIVLFELREKLEWKSTEDKAKQKIGRKIRALFADVSIFCKVERTHYDDAEERIKLTERQLDELISKEIEFTTEAKKDLLDADLRRFYGEHCDSISHSLEILEIGYARFLNSESETSLMKLQDYLDKLSLKFKLRHTKDEDYFESIAHLIKEIMKEIRNLKTNGIWFNW